MLINTWKQILTCCSRTDIVVAAICPEWFKLIETWVSKSFDSSVVLEYQGEAIEQAMTMIIDYTCSSIRRKGLRSGENSAHKASPIEKEISNNRGTPRAPPLQIPTSSVIETYDIQIERKHAQVFGSIPQRLWRFQRRRNPLGVPKDDTKRKIANGHVTHDCLSFVPVARAPKIPAKIGLRAVDLEMSGH